MSIGTVGLSTNNPYYKQTKQTKDLSEQNSTTTNNAAINDKQASLDQGEVANKQAEPESNYVKSFAYGVLGMDKPGEVKENEDNGYTAGQIFKAIGTVGSIIAIIV